MADNILQSFALKIDEAIETAKNVMARGGCPTYEAYRELVGKIEGLMLVKENIEDYFKRLERWENDG